MPPNFSLHAVLARYKKGEISLEDAEKEIDEADAFVVSAGCEESLPAVVAGLGDKPVIEVPVSTGYGYMGGGRAALASMLPSCSIAVVHIVAGFTAGVFAPGIADQGAKP